MSYMKKILILILLTAFILGCNNGVKVEEGIEPVIEDEELIQEAIDDFELSIRTINSILYLDTISSDMKYEIEKQLCDEWESKDNCVKSCTSPGIFKDCNELCGEDCYYYAEKRVMNEIANTDVSVQFEIKKVKINEDKAQVNVEIYSEDNKEKSEILLELVKEPSGWKVTNDWISIS